MIRDSYVRPRVINPSMGGGGVSTPIFGSFVQQVGLALHAQLVPWCIPTVRQVAAPFVPPTRPLIGPLSSLQLPNLKGTRFAETSTPAVAGVCAIVRMSACNAAESTRSVSAIPHSQAIVSQLLAIPVTTRPHRTPKGAPVLRERSPVVFNCPIPQLVSALPTLVEKEWQASCPLPPFCTAR